jgi:hypothetical protein
MITLRLTFLIQNITNNQKPINNGTSRPKKYKQKHTEIKKTLNLSISVHPPLQTIRSISKPSQIIFLL